MRQFLTKITSKLKKSAENHHHLYARFNVYQIDGKYLSKLLESSFLRQLVLRILKKFE